VFALDFEADLVRGVPIDDVLAALRVECEPVPSGGSGHSDYSLLELTSGWNLVFLDGRDANLGRLAWHAKVLARRGGDAVHFSCSDTTMITEIGGVVNGSAWTLGYNGNDGIDPDEVRVDGDPPSFVEELIAAHLRDQESDPEPEAADRHPERFVNGRPIQKSPPPAAWINPPPMDQIVIADRRATVCGC
jgi:hypothetical protein